MNGISHRQSRGNSARRMRRLKARHAKARRSRTSSRPVIGAGRVHYEIGARVNAMSYGGIGAMQPLVSRLGLVREVNARHAFDPWNPLWKGRSCDGWGCSTRHHTRENRLKVANSLFLELAVRHQRDDGGKVIGVA